MNIILFIIGITLLGFSFNADSILHWTGTIGGIIMMLASIIDKITIVVGKLIKFKDKVKKLFKKDATKNIKYPKLDK